MTSQELPLPNQKQVLSKLYPLYHDDYRELCRTYLRVDEEVLFASTCSQWLRYGYLVITPKRAVIVLFDSGDSWFRSSGRKGIHYETTKQPGYSAVKLYWYPELAPPLSVGEIERRTVGDALHSALKRVEEKTYTTEYRGQNINLLQITPHGEPSSGWDGFSKLCFEESSGKEACELLVGILRGEINPSPNQNFISELERLSVLFQKGLLSSEQFEAAKNKLLEE
jgi:hypothetical protein